MLPMYFIYGIKTWLLVTPDIRRPLLLFTRSIGGASMAVALIFAVSLGGQIDGLRDRRAVYGADDRTDDPVAFAGQDAAFWAGIGSKTVMLSRPNYWQCGNTTCNLNSQISTFSYRYGTQQCNGAAMPFASQRTAGHCSGTLIGHDDQGRALIATAGHCIEDALDCANTKVIFNATATAISALSVPADHAYDCDAIVAGDLATAYVSAQYSVNQGWGPNRNIDWAVIRLDRGVPTSVATPVTVRLAVPAVALEDDIMMIGHPTGLPRKYATGQVAQVYNETTSGQYQIVTNLDSFGGNSGSGVFNSNGEQIGILVRGATDFNRGTGCYNIAVCSQNTSEIRSRQMSGGGCGGEQLTGSNVLGSVLTAAAGCSQSLPCLRGGNCQTNGTCSCPSNTFGPNCIQAKDNAFCNCVTNCTGRQVNTGWLQCGPPPEPLSDLVAAAPYLNCSSTTSGNTLIDGVTSIGQSSPELLYRLVLTSGGTVSINTCGSSYDTYIAVYVASELAASPNAQVLAFNDDHSDNACSNSSHSSLTVQLSAGQYIILVEGYSNNAGQFQLSTLCSNGAVSANAPTNAPTNAPFGLNQADDVPPPQYIQCFNSRAPTYLAALNQADVCVDYDGTNATRCLASNRTLSDPDFCTPLITPLITSVNALGVSCKKFTSVASQFCSLIDMEINPNFVAADLQDQALSSDEEVWLELLEVVPELYNESCRDIVRNYTSTDPVLVQSVSNIVNVMCKNRDSSEDDNSLAIELGVGLGVGIPFTGGLIYFIVKRSKKVETTESIEPFLN